MQEWLNWHAWKACIPERVSRVRIPLSPQSTRPVGMDSARIRWKPQAYERILAESIARAARQALLIDSPPKGIAVRQSLSSMNTN